MSTSGLSQKQQASTRPHFRAVHKVLWTTVKNCVRNCSRLDEIDAETEICISLKSEFYFRFRWPSNTKPTLISYISVRVIVTISGKICPPQSQNWKMGILHTSIKSVIYLRFVSEKNTHLANQISAIFVTVLFAALSIYFFYRNMIVSVQTNKKH